MGRALAALYCGKYSPSFLPLSDPAVKCKVFELRFPESLEESQTALRGYGREGANVSVKGNRDILIQTTGKTRRAFFPETFCQDIPKAAVI